MVTQIAAPAEPTVVRRVFEAWSIEVPASFEETFVQADSYWHAYGEDRSVSMTSIVLTDKGRPVSAERIARRIPPLDGSPVEVLPIGLIGRAATGAADQPARASQALSGALAAEGRLLLVTITSDDPEWAQRVWRSIRGHPAPLPSRSERRARRYGRRGGR